MCVCVRALGRGGELGFFLCALALYRREDKAL